ncbi:hypothetical protein BH23VER1_BH23VER1_14430 [soil metagenome]
MPPPLLADGFRFALRESTLSGIIICCILMLLSCFSWAVMVTKMRVLAKAGRQGARFTREFRQSGSPLQLFQDGSAFHGAPQFAVYLTGCRELTFHLLGSSETDETFAARLRAAAPLNPAQMSGICTAMERAVSEAVLRLESGMAMLATAVSGAPFLGLLGTVWGVMDTFGGVAVAEGAASIKTMAPGVSAALVTTVVGLFVAIPAMFGYNYLVNSIRAKVAQLDNFAAELAGAFERRYVDFGRPRPGAEPVRAAAGAAPKPGLTAFGSPSPGLSRLAPKRSAERQVQTAETE